MSGKIETRKLFLQDHLKSFHVKGSIQTTQTMLQRRLKCENLMNNEWQVVRVMVFNATFNNISAISWQLVWWRKWEYLEKINNLLQVTDKTLSHNVVWSTPRPSRIQTDCIGRCKSKYNMITITTAWQVM